MPGSVEGAGRALRALALLVLLVLLPPPGLAEPGAARDGRSVSCVAPVPNLAWYLDGEQQESDGSGGLVAFGEGGSGGGFAVTARRLDRQLNCSATDPLGGRVSSASVLLDVQFRPELVAVEAQFAEGGEPGLQLALLVLVRARPPASITWVDRDGRRTLNASRFLIVGAQTFPWPADHPLRLRLQLGDPARNFSFDSSGFSNASVPLPGFLDTLVELPVLALLLCGTAALGTLLILGALLGCLGYRKGKAAAGLAHSAQLPLSPSSNLKPAGAGLPRTIRSLPANWRLHDFAPKARAQGLEDGTAAEQEAEGLSEPEDSLAHRGLGQFPMVGYIYRASSMSSDEIWL